MGMSTNRAGTGKNSGWARQQNVNTLPVATEMAGVDMALAPNAYRELHWHSAGEWSYIFNGSCRVTAVNENGEAFVDDLNAGDLWFFPAGSMFFGTELYRGITYTNLQQFLIQSKLSMKALSFFLYSTRVPFQRMIPTWFPSFSFAIQEKSSPRTSRPIFRTSITVSTPWYNSTQTCYTNTKPVPSDQLYIFNGTPAPANLSEVRQNITGPSGYLPKNQSYTYHLSQQSPYEVPGGSVKIVDPTVFHIASDFSVALFTIAPGAMREIHWHLTSDEWSFFIAGSARLTVFQGPANSRTFDFQAGDVGYVPAVDSHYVENVGAEDVVYMEVLQAPKYTDISVGQWLGLTPPQVVADTLHLPESLISRLSKVKQYIIPGNANVTATGSITSPKPTALGFSR